MAQSPGIVNNFYSCCSCSGDASENTAVGLTEYWTIIDAQHINRSPLDSLPTNIFSTNVFESNWNEQRIIQLFPNRPHKMTALDCSLVKLNESGSYSGTILSRLIKLDFQGNLVGTVSTSDFDLSSASLKSWNDIPLDTASQVNDVDVDEILALEMFRTGNKGGNYKVGVDVVITAIR